MRQRAPAAPGTLRARSPPQPNPTWQPHPDHARARGRFEAPARRGEIEPWTKTWVASGETGPALDWRRGRPRRGHGTRDRLGGRGLYAEGAPRSKHPSRQFQKERRRATKAARSPTPDRRRLSIETGSRRMMGRVRRQRPPRPMRRTRLAGRRRLSQRGSHRLPFRRARRRSSTAKTSPAGVVYPGVTGRFGTERSSVRRPTASKHSRFCAASSRTGISN